MVESVEINTEFITLGQFLKLATIIDSGGQAKFFLQEYQVWINGEQENRRGKKLYNGDMIKVDQYGEYQIVSKV